VLASGPSGTGGAVFELAEWNAELGCDLEYIGVGHT
jgi:hypothetical protein